MKYTKGSEKWIKANENKFKNVEGSNEQYWLDFEENSGKSKGSLAQYKSAVRRLLENSDNKDALTITVNDIELYIETIENEKTKDTQRRYINSFLSHIITSNMAKAIAVTNSELILSIIPDEYKSLMRVLMSK